MSKSVSMTDIAKLFNVSKVTVSKALNNKPGVSDALRKQIKLKANELGFKNTYKKSNIKNSTNIGILIADRYIGKDHSYYSIIYGKLSAQLASLGYSCIGLTSSIL